MADRTRPIRIEFCVTEQEKKLIQHKMAQLGTHNMGAYLRKMAIDGYIIKVDYTEQKKLAAAVSRAAANINHICRRINQTGHFYEDDIVELKAKQCEIWELLKQSQRAELCPQRDYPCMDFPSPDFQKVDNQTLRSAPLLDFRTSDFRTFTEDEIHTQINKK